jgi:hypothetical protein
VSEDRLEVQTSDQSLDEARRIVARHRKSKGSMVEMLREERRQEAAREQKDAEAHGEGI